MKVSLKTILKNFIDNYVKVDLEIRKNKIGFETILSGNENHGKYTISKHSKCITHWFYDEHGKSFEEFQLVKDKGNILIQNKHNKTLIKFSCPTEPLIITN